MYSFIFQTDCNLVSVSQKYLLVYFDKKCTKSHIQSSAFIDFFTCSLVPYIWYVETFFVWILVWRIQVDFHEDADFLIFFQCWYQNPENAEKETKRHERKTLMISLRSIGSTAKCTKRNFGPGTVGMFLGRISKYAQKRLHFLVVGHMRSKTELWWYQTQPCWQTFDRSQSCKSHALYRSPQLHVYLFGLQCTAQSTDLLIHVVILFQASSTQFKVSGYRVAHEKVCPFISNRKEFECKWCGLVYYTLAMLNRHARNKHG